MYVRLVATGHERGQLRRLAERLDQDPTDQLRFCARAEDLSGDLPDRISTFLNEFGHGRQGVALLLSNLPIGSVPPTPQGNRSHLGKTTVLSRVQAIVNHRIGSMVAYEAQADGQLFHDLVPTKGESGLQTSLSYEVELDGHTEQCFSALRPDFLSLACLRPDRDSYTYFYPAADLARRMPASRHEALFEAMWETGVDTSFTLLNDALAREGMRGPIVLLRGDRGDPFITVDETLTHGLSAGAQQLLDEVIDLYNRHHEVVQLEQGDLLLLDNNRCVHGRSPFAPRLDGTDRFLVRSFVVRPERELEFAMAPGSRTLMAGFS